MDSCINVVYHIILEIRNLRIAECPFRSLKGINKWCQLMQKFVYFAPLTVLCELGVNTSENDLEQFAEGQGGSSANNH